MRDTDRTDVSIWSAALMAAKCQAYREKGRPYPVRWQHAQDHVRFVAHHNVVVQPLGVRLSPGEILEVRWDPNETSYTMAIRSAQ
jgi:hypothetical protein